MEAIIEVPEVLFLDEPFATLDAPLPETLSDDLRTLRKAEQMCLTALAVVVLDERQRGVALIAAATKTETIGAEKGFVSPLDDAMRIRMGEHGTSVLCGILTRRTLR